MLYTICYRLYPVYFILYTVYYVLQGLEAAEKPPNEALKAGPEAAGKPPNRRDGGWKKYGSRRRK